MAWKLSVIEPVPDFCRGYSYTTTLSGDVTSGSNIIVAKSSSEFYLQKGDILKIGPSSHSNNLGRYEFCRISTMSGTSITFIDNLVYDYKSGDSIEGSGHAIAEGWKVIDEGSPGNFRFQGIFPKGGVDGEVQKGYLGATGVQRVNKSSIGSSGAIWYRMYARTQLLYTVPYRLLGYIKTSTNYSGATSFRIYEDSTTIFITMSITSTAGNWVKYENVGTTSSVIDPFIVEFRFNYNTFFTYFLIGTVYLTHALMTDGQSSGVYSFPIDPVNVVRLNEEKDTALSARYSNTIYAGSLDVLPIRGYRILFADADSDFIRQLEIFQYWQNQGYLLLLESDIDAEKPLVGFMDYKPKLVHWDLNKIAVDFVFRGI